MASIKYGGGIVQMSGSIAGNTFARNRSGNYVRARTKPVNPKTDLQSLVRTALANLTDRWARILDAPQRLAWNDYAAGVSMKNRLGEAINLTGFNHYIRSNAIRAAHAKAVIDDGPVIFELPATDPKFRITATEDPQQISLAFDDTMDWAKENDAYIFGFGGRPQNAQRNFFGGPWRYAFAEKGDSVDPTSSPQLSGSPFHISEGQHLWYYLRISMADGRLSEPFSDDTFVAANGA